MCCGIPWTWTIYLTWKWPLQQTLCSFAVFNQFVLNDNYKLIILVSLNLNSCRVSGSWSVSCLPVWRCQPLCHPCEASHHNAQGHSACAPNPWPWVFITFWLFSAALWYWGTLKWQLFTCSSVFSLSCYITQHVYHWHYLFLVTQLNGNGVVALFNSHVFNKHIENEFTLQDSFWHFILQERK